MEDPGVLSPAALLQLSIHGAVIVPGCEAVDRRRLLLLIPLPVPVPVPGDSNTVRWRGTPLDRSSYGVVTPTWRASVACTSSSSMGDGRLSSSETDQAGGVEAWD